MGCFCRNLVLPEAPAGSGDQDAGSKDAAVQTDPLIAAVAGWLAARWLPAPAWQPDPEWHDIAWPAAPMEPAAMAVLASLVVARKACQTAFQIDPAQPEQLSRLTRIVATLNRRTEALQRTEADQRPWAELAAWNAQIDTVRKAVSDQVFHDPPAEAPLGPWRPVLAKVKALAPLVAVARLQELDFRQPESVDALARTVRDLRRVTLPELADAPLILRLVAQSDAVARLTESLGADPRPHAFTRVAAAVQRKADAVAASLPKALALHDGQVQGMPARQPNPGQVLNAQTVAAARRLTPAVLDRLRWQVPDAAELPLLTVAGPVAALTQAMRRLGPDPVRQTPCGNQCDAPAAMRQLKAPPGSGTGAAPAG